EAGAAPGGSRHSSRARWRSGGAVDLAAAASERGAGRTSVSSPAGWAGRQVALPPRRRHPTPRAHAAAPSHRDAAPAARPGGRAASRARGTPPRRAATGAASEPERHLRRETARRRDVELRVADLALRRVVAAVAQVAPDEGDAPPGALPRGPRVPLVERAGEE